MKHVFIIHSNITEILMEMIIQHQNLNAKDIIIFYHRNYSPQCQYKTARLPKCKNQSILRIFLWLIGINHIIKSNYTVYLPQSSVLEFGLFIINKKCKGYHYTEEGLASYMEKKLSLNSYSTRIFSRYVITNNIYFFHPLFFDHRDFQDLIIKCNFFYFQHRKYQGSFALSEKSFKIDEKRILLNPLSHHYAKVGSNKKYDCIITFDAAVIYNIINLEDSFKILKDDIYPFIQKKGYSSVAYKLHPEHFSTPPIAKKEAELIRRLMRDKNIEELDKNFPLENYFISHIETDVIIYYSSAGYYASLFGCKVYSVYSKLCQLSSFRLPNFVEEKYTDLYSS